jgi:hypothetical protein
MMEKFALVKEGKISAEEVFNGKFNWYEILYEMLFSLKCYFSLSNRFGVFIWIFYL